LLLRTSGVQKIVIAGVCTNICCEATAHDAFFRDFNVYFLLDGTGATDEEAHISTLRNIALCYGHVITVDQAIRGLNCSTVEPVKEFDRTGNQLIEDAARHTAATFNL
jgi:nicotinamidase-related amidase